ncbi:hypothetical protein vseg_016835 [Gypsophila vaccaria]
MHHLRRISSAVISIVNRQITSSINLLELPESYRTFFSRSFGSDHRSLLQENEFHKLADSTIHHLLEKLEEYGDNVDIDGSDVDYGNKVLSPKLGDTGTYVVNKQTPNRQIWLSSPVR